MKTIKISLMLALGLLVVQAFSQKAQIELDPGFAENTPAMTVKGRNGFQIGQKISFGEFKTGKVRRGWTKGYNVPFRVRFRGAKEKLSFTQFGPDGQQAEVAAISKFKSTEIMTARDYFSIPLDIDNTFAGNISFDNGRTDWDFIVYNPNGDFLRDQASAGFIKNSSQQIDIQAIRGLKGQPKWLKELIIYGHEFRIDGKTVAAVSTLNKGAVWMDPALDSETKTVIAAVATGLLLRNDVEEAAVGD